MTKTLLLADDSVTIQKVVGITFANEDVHLVTASNGDDALRKARELKPDLVMADIGMPGLDGYELCAAIRQEPELASIPVLLLTGTFETYDEERAAEVRASAYIAKPFEAQALIDQVYALLNAPAGAEEASPASSESEAGPRSSEDTLGETVLAGPAFDVSSMPDPLASPGANSAVPGQSDELPHAEPPDLLAGTPGGPAPDPDPEAARVAKADLSFEDLNFQDSPPDPGSNTQIFGAGSPLGTGPSGNPGLPPADAPDLDAAGFPPLGGEMGDEPVAETLDTEHGLDQNMETKFFDPAIDVPTRPDQDPVDAASWPAREITADPSDPMRNPEPSADLSDAPLPPAEMPNSPVLEMPELLPDADPLSESSVAAPESIAESIRVDESPSATQPMPALDQDAISSTIEKVAWEAFGNLSEQLVREVVKKVEAIAWEVVPQLAERMLQAEIEKLKREP